MSAGRRGLICLLLLSGFMQLAWGHTLQQTTSELVWQPDTGLLEIAHALHLDDALQLMADLGHPEGDMTVALQAKLMFYLERRFSLLQNRQPLVLDPIGVQILGDFVWLYQEVQLSSPPEQLAVEMSLLQEYHVDQSHLVNLIIGDHVRTLNLSQESPKGTF